MTQPRLRRTRSRAFIPSASSNHPSPAKIAARRHAPSMPSALAGPSRPPQKRVRIKMDLDQGQRDKEREREPARRKRRLTESESEEIFDDDDDDDEDDEGDGEVSEGEDGSEDEDENGGIGRGRGGGRARARGKGKGKGGMAEDDDIDYEESGGDSYRQPQPHRHQQPTYRSPNTRKPIDKSFSASSYPSPHGGGASPQIPHNHRQQQQKRILYPLTSEKTSSTSNHHRHASSVTTRTHRARRQSSSTPHPRLFGSSSKARRGANGNGNGYAGGSRHVPTMLRGEAAHAYATRGGGGARRMTTNGKLTAMLAAGSPRKRKRDEEYSETDADGDEEEEEEDEDYETGEDQDDASMDQDHDPNQLQDTALVEEDEDGEEGDRTVTAATDPSIDLQSDDDDDERMSITSSSYADLSSNRLPPIVDLIADSDQFLLHDATSGQLHRLKKAELIRLWKVAGMWTGEDELDELGLGHGEELHGNDEEEIGKKELVEGLIEARAARNAPSPSAFSPRLLARLPLHSRQSSASASINDPFNSPRRSSASSDFDESSPAAGPSKGKGMATRGDRDVGGGRKMKTRHSLGLGLSVEGERRARFGSDVQSPAVLGGRSGGLGRDRRSSHGSSATSSTSRSRSPLGLRPRPANINRGKQLPMTGKNARNGKSGASDQPIDLSGSDDGEGVDEDNATADDEAVDTETDSSDERRKLRSRLTTGKVLKSAKDRRPPRKAKQKAIAALANGEDSSDQMDVDDDEEEPEADTEEEDREMDLSVEAIATPEGYRKKGTMTRSRNTTHPKGTAGSSTSRNSGPRRLRSARKEASMSPDIGGYASTEGGSPIRDMSPESPDPQRRRRGLRRSSLVMRLEEMEIDGVDGNGEEEEMDDTESAKPESSTSRASAAASGSQDDDMEAGEDQDEADFDLAEEDLSSLLKYNKQTLVKMCEGRELAVDGTKRDLASYLLGWRDSPHDASSAPSSASTAKPISVHSNDAPPTAAAKGKSRAMTVPILLQNHSTVADPDTPPLSAEHEGQDAVEGGLDLEELGLLDREIDASKIEKGTKIGSGGYKDVFMGKIGTKSVAVCEFRGALSEMDIRELKLLAEFDHPNIVRLLGLSVPEDKSIPCMIITELCHKGDLFDYIRKTPAPPFRKILKMMIDIASGLEYLHEHKPRVIHRDCKSSNILITQTGKAKVGDFGLARVKSTSRSVINSLVGTVNWQAPELWHPKPRYDYKVDVFSCGMVFWEMLHGWHSTNIQYPWEGKNEHWIYDAVGQKRQRPATSILRKHWGGEIVELVERMWAHDPAERPTMTDVLDDLRAILDEQPKPPMRI